MKIDLVHKTWITNGPMEQSHAQGKKKKKIRLVWLSSACLLLAIQSQRVIKTRIVQVFKCVSNSFVNTPFAVSDVPVIFNYIEYLITFRRMMRFGNTIGFDAAMQMVTTSSISADAFLKFFEPLDTWLDKQIQKFNIPIGWK